MLSKHSHVSRETSEKLEKRNYSVLNLKEM